jgi:hypothetical protein
MFSSMTLYYSNRLIRSRRVFFLPFQFNYCARYFKQLYLYHLRFYRNCTGAGYRAEYCSPKKCVQNSITIEGIICMCLVVEGGDYW